MKLSIIVPVYNEEKTIKNILDKLSKVDLGGWSREVVIVEDKSTDKTREILQQYKKSPAIKIIYHSQNQGKTGGIKTAQKGVTGDYVIIQDADLEYDPADIQKLLTIAEKNPQAVVYGSRFKNQSADTILGHRVGNQFLTILTNFLFNCHLTDMQTCYKLIPTKIFKEIEIETNRFGFEPEITSKLLNNKIQIIEEPISYKNRTFSEGKKLNWWKDGWITVGVLLRYRFQMQ